MVFVINVMLLQIQFYQLILVFYAVPSLLDVQNVLMEMPLMQLPALNVQKDTGVLLNALNVMFHVLLALKPLVNAKMDIMIKTQHQLHAQLVTLEMPKPDVN